MVSLTFQGDDALTNAIRALPQAVRKPTLVKVLTVAAEPLRARIASNAPRSDEAPHIADNIVITTLRKVDGVAIGENEAAVGVGPSKGFSYGLLSEFGFKAPHPFVRPAYDEDKPHALKRIGDGLWAEVSGRGV